MVSAATRRFGRVDILVNNAATNTGLQPCLEIDEGQSIRWSKRIEERLPAHTLSRSRDVRARSGSIINIASTSGLRPHLHALLYSMTRPR